jgi:CO/xanthine dehydrogenase Mo-binding subunit
VGGILARCAQELRTRIGSMSPAAHFRAHGETSVTEQYRQPPGLAWDDATYRGDAYGTYAWGCDVVEVTYDPVSYAVQATKLTAVQEFGRPINPVLARGQIEGGSAQGVGWALIEDVVMKDGAMANAQLTNYTIPTTLDTPRMDVVMVENPYPHGAFGAKGVGELPMNGPGPAVVNALRHIGLDVRRIPATPETVMEAARGRA